MPQTHADPDRDPFDDASYWVVRPGQSLGPFQLNSSREDVLQQLKAKDLDFEEDDEDPTIIHVFDLEVILYFAETPSQPLVLIVAEDERVRFGTLKVLGDFPHNILGMMQIPETETVWCDDLNVITKGLPITEPGKRASDQELLDKGTLWISTIGIGLGLYKGAIVSLHLCDPSLSPPPGNGGFSSDQRHLSERMQLASFKKEVSKRHPMQTLVSLGLLLIAIGIGAYFGKQAWDSQQLWDNAPEVEGEVIAVWPPPPEPFPSKLTVQYADSKGELHQVEWGNQDVYVTSKVGEKVTVKYLKDSPEIALGPAKLQDVGFNQFTPYLLGTFVIFFTLHFFSDFVLAKLFKT
ncbi:MAG: DUF3592 domain-containing protein [Pirellulales bacterium]